MNLTSCGQFCVYYFTSLHVEHRWVWAKVILRSKYYLPQQNVIVLVALKACPTPSVIQWSTISLFKHMRMYTNCTGLKTLLNVYRKVGMRFKYLGSENVRSHWSRGIWGVWIKQLPSPSTHLREYFLPVIMSIEQIIFVGWCSLGLIQSHVTKAIVVFITLILMIFKLIVLSQFNTLHLHWPLNSGKREEDNLTS